MKLNMESFLERLRSEAMVAAWASLDAKPPRSQAITLPLLPEFSKDPLDAELVVEDVLDAELIG